MSSTGTQETGTAQDPVLDQAGGETATAPDPARVEEFAGEVVDLLNKGVLALLVSVGHQTGLFDAMDGLPPATSEEIATRAGLDERYVREWLGGTVVGGIVTYEPAGRRYRLPPEHAASLTSAAGTENLAALMPYVALLGEVEQRVVRCFREGGGVPYSAYPRFQALQAAETARVYDEALVDTIVPLVPGLTERLRSGISALDVGTGHGRAPLVLAEAFPASTFHGVDRSEEGIDAARAEAARRGVTNVHYTVGDATELSGAHDLVTAFDVIHDLAEPARTLDAIAGALTPDGTFLMGDMDASSNLEENIGHPFGPALFGFSVFYCMTTSLGTGGAGLGTVWGRQTARRMLGEAGFGQVDIRSVEGDPLNVYYVAAKG